MYSKKIIPYIWQGFNRNIVECKCKITALAEYGINGLIETLWNVNQLVTMASTLMSSGLIETLWNVNMLWKTAR